MVTPAPRVVNGRQSSRIVYPARRRPRGPQEIADTLQPIVAERIRAASDWPDVALGESRCLIFEAKLPCGVDFWVRLWFEAQAPVLYEIQSGVHEDAFRRSLAAGAAKWAEDHGLVLSRERQNYQGRLPCAGPEAIDKLAALVVGAFVSMGGYQGVTPLVATIAHDTRCGWNQTLDSFTEEEVARAFRAEGFTTEWIMAGCGGHVTDPPAFVARKGITESVIQLMDPVDDRRLYRRIRFDTIIPMPPDQAAEYRRRGDLPPRGGACMEVSGIHSCIGGVTKRWLLELVRDWDRMFRAPGYGARRGRRRRPAASSRAGMVH